MGKEDGGDFRITVTGLCGGSEMHSVEKGTLAHHKYVPSSSCRPGTVLGTGEAATNDMGETLPNGGHPCLETWEGST